MDILFLIFWMVVLGLVVYYCSRDDYSDYWYEDSKRWMGRYFKAESQRVNLYHECERLRSVNKTLRRKLRESQKAVQ